jgi:hypothetical protein
MTPHELQALLRANPDLAAANDADALDTFADINDALFGPGDASSEHDAQVAVFAWAAANVDRLPELALLFAIPNGSARHPAVGKKLKAEGVKRGYPDIGLDVARGPYHGFRGELKHGKNKPSPEQLWWLDQLQRQGYFCTVQWTSRAMIREIEWYLGLEENDDAD